MRDGKGFVQVQMADIAADFARLRQPDHGVHIRAVNIHLPAKFMRDGADIADGFFKHAVG